MVIFKLYPPKTTGYVKRSDSLFNIQIIFSFEKKIIYFVKDLIKRTLLHNFSEKHHMNGCFLAYQQRPQWESAPFRQLLSSDNCPIWTTAPFRQLPQRITGNYPLGQLSKWDSCLKGALSLWSSC